MTAADDLGAVVGIPHRSGMPHPSAPALVAGDRVMTHGDAAAAVARIAGALRQRDIGPGCQVGIPASPSLDGVLAVLGVLAAGAAYVPLRREEESPVELAASFGRDLEVDTLLSAGTAYIAEHDPDGSAYVITTSGTTATPKAVVVTRGNLDAMFGSVHALLAGTVGRDRRWAHLHPLSFGYSVWELLGAITFSGTIVLVDREEPLTLQGLFRRLPGDVDVLSLTPSESAILASALASGRLGGACLPGVLVLSGEPARGGVLRTIFDAATVPPVVVNTYALTETAGQVAVSIVRADDLQAVERGLVGRPLPGVQVAISTGAGVSAPLGEVGEIFVTGPTVARGYVDHGQTAERFSHTPDGPTFATRDLGWLDAHGDLYVVGRGARRVKVSGDWVELDALESRLSAYPEVADALVTTVRGPKRVELVAVASLHADSDLVRNAVRRRFIGELGGRVGVRLFVVDRVPQTASGKKDRAAGVQAIVARSPATKSTASIREVVLDVWRTVLGDGVTQRDNIFEIGADSLLVVEAAERLSIALGRTIEPALVLDAPRIATLVARLEGHVETAVVRRRADIGALARRRATARARSLTTGRELDPLN